MENYANNPELKSWIEVEMDSDFPIQNLPFGIYQKDETNYAACSAIGKYIIDLNTLHESGFFSGINLPQGIFANKFLNDFISLGKKTGTAVRNRLVEIFKTGNTEFSNRIDEIKLALKKQSDIILTMPVHVGDYTDFYSSIDHATNIGKMIRDPENALLPNWKHLPVGYHGRASSIFVSGHEFRRPKGQSKPADSPNPIFGPCKLLDFELETAFIIGKETKNGESISTEEADDYIFGMVLFNDWSARDIQTWEYVPLGPFLAKNFASTISPWIVTLEALEPFRVKGYDQNPAVLPYLQYSGEKNIDIKLEVYIQPENKKPSLVCSSNFKYMYWTMEQQLAHHTINGCNMNVGDMLASGTISGPQEHEFGSMMELSWKGTKSVKLDDEERKFIQDLDTVIIRGFCNNGKTRIGFGECKAKVLPAI